MFYALKNFYQNHRRYIRSRNDNQLLGNLQEKLDPDDCKPYRDCGNSIDCCNGAVGEGPCGNKLPNETVYLPCGAIANSFFSDIISLKYGNSM